MSTPNDIWVSAALKLAEQAGMSRNESNTLLDTRGATELLAECVARGARKSIKPMIAEMPFEVMVGQDYQMPNSVFYTFAHGRAPVVDIDTWRLKIEGDGIEKPLELSYNGLVTLPSKTYDLRSSYSAFIAHNRW